MRTVLTVAEIESMKSTHFNENHPKPFAHCTLPTEVFPAKYSKLLGMNSFWEISESSLVQIVMVAAFNTESVCRLAGD